jgi:hypothetical protein
MMVASQILTSHRAVIVAALSLIASASGTAVADERAFKEHCATCHRHVALVTRRLTGETAEERAASLDRFLATHHAENPKLRAVIVDYLTALSSQ